MTLYIETSAAAELIVDEPASGRLAAYLDKAATQDNRRQADAAEAAGLPVQAP